jgi:hypothetical protein
MLIEATDNILLVILPRHALVRKGERIDPVLLRTLESKRLGDVRDHDNNITVNLSSFAGVYDCLEVCPAARSQNPNPQSPHRKPLVRDFSTS